ncbi:formimidoylglutamase [Planomicrobium sp. CPCC 101110]|uniref:formimidoylglutamase n=1 Tax=Planomicrobium sp. CPCC 101110 TaxID=2599619 RepID=UPI0011B7F665|nr:formimidoylglutamase [Planomicrobium sp. CPCC 101110]TWT25316.1 formimidoylglutamase [Planomicrobium sp. CPCC 101110]
MYKLPKKHFWHGRVDSETDRSSFRFHQTIEFMDTYDVPEGAFSIIGFECDEGVQRNGGQAGAADAANEIRRHLADLPYHLGDRQTFDVGSVMCKNNELEKAQRELGNHVSLLLASGSVPIILGGGHETAYGHYLGLRRTVGPDARIGIINIDAHFDLRKAARPNSGTMFRQILEQDGNAGYLFLGIQPLGNTKTLFNYAEELGVEYVLAEALTLLELQNTQRIIDSFCENYDHILITLCMDSITSLYAPGVLAPSPFGLDPAVVRRLLWHIVSNEKVRSFDVSEVDPALDDNGKTAKLAAYLVAEVMAAFH